MVHCQQVIFGRPPDLLARKAVLVRRSPLLAALLALALLAACGGDGEGDDDQAVVTSAPQTTEAEAEADGTDADDYAEQACAAIGAWYDEIETASTTLVNDADAIADDPAAGKDLVVAFLDDAIDFTDDLVADLRDAGIPDTETGERTADELVSGIEDVRELFEGARDDTEALPADDPEALGTGLQDIGMALQESATAVGANFEAVLSSVDDPELGAAFEDAPACRDLATIS